jgi:DNA-binding response OmpR family regulator
MLMPNTTRKRLILVVDDHPSILRFIQIGLEMRDFDVVTASSGERALELAESTKPDAMVLDVIMPDMDGFDVLTTLRQKSQVPIIVISADIETRPKALQLGANEFVAKPFNTDQLVNRIKTMLGD